MTPTAKHYAAVHAACKALNIDDEGRRNLIFSYTADVNKLSCRDLSIHQINDLIKRLNAQQQASMPAKTNTKVNTMRNKVFAHAHNMHWYKMDVFDRLILGKDDRRQLDYNRINAYCLMHTAAKKKLKDMTIEELQAAVLQFELMETNYRQSKKKQ